jgi:hypothetical protein
MKHLETAVSATTYFYSYDCKSFFCERLLTLPITLPAFYTYRNRLDNNQLNATIEYIDYITKENNVYYYNFLNDAEFIEEDYFDADH